MQFVRSKTGIAVVLGVFAFLFLYLFTGVFGGTRLNLTLFSNQNIASGLIAHYTFDADNIDPSATSAEIIDSSTNGNDGDLIGSTNSEVLIDSSGVSAAGSDIINLGSSPTVVWISEDEGFIFYNNGPDGSTADIQMASTTDGGLTWGNFQQVDDINTADAFQVSVWYDRWTPGDTGDLIHIITQDNGVDDIYYTEYNTVTNALSSTNLTLTQTGQADSASTSPSITKTEDGTLWAAVKNNADGWTISCTSSCTSTTWTQTASQGHVGHSDSSEEPNILLPVAGTDNLMLIVWDRSASDIYSRIYSATSSSWWPVDTIDSSVTPGEGYVAGELGAALNPITGEIYLVYQEDVDDYSTSDHDILFWEFDNETFAWTQGTNVVTNASGLTGVAIAVDTVSEDIYVAYVRRTTIGSETSGNVYYRVSTDNGSTWSAESSALTSTADDIYGLSLNQMSEHKIGVVYEYTSGGNADDIYYQTIADLKDRPKDKIKPGRIGQGLQFDGVDDYIDAGDLGTSMQSIAFWLKTSSSSQDIIQFSSGGAAQYANQYSYRRSITVDNTQVSGSSNHSNFPVLISEVIADLRTTGNGGKVENANGYDIIFSTDSNGASTLDHEIESYDATSGEINMWVEVPTLDYNDDTVIYMFYGSSTISSSQENINGTWNSDYEGVWHLNETAGQHEDSTSNNNDSTTVTVTTQGTADAKIGGASDFDGVNDQVIVADAASLDVTNTGTFEAWMSADQIVSIESNFNDWMSITAPGGAAAGEYGQAAITVVGDTMYYIAGLCNGANEQLSIASSSLDGSNMSAWDVKTDPPQCGGGEGMTVAIDSDGDTVYYSYLVHGNANVIDFYTATSGPDFVNEFSGNLDQLNPTSGSWGAADDTGIDMVIIDDTIYYSASAHLDGTNDFFVTSSNLDFSTFNAWTDTADNPTGAGQAESTNPAMDSDGNNIYYVNFAHNGAIETMESNESAVGGSIGTWQSRADDPDGAGPGDPSNGDVVLIGDTLYMAYFSHNVAVEVYDTGSTTVDWPATVTWTDRVDGSGNPNGANDGEPSDPSIGTDGKYLYYSALAVDTNTELFYVSSSTLNAGPIIYKPDAYEILQNGRGFVFDWAGAPKTFATNTQQSTYVHVAVTHDGADMVYYIDGAEWRRQSVTADFESNGNSLYFGGDSGFFFDGRLDEIRISSTARSGDWIATGYNNQDATSTFYTVGSEETPTSSEVNISIANNIVTTNDFTSPTIYVNGEVSSEISAGWSHVVVVNSTTLTTDDVQIGLIGGYFDGIIDDVRFYSTQLSPEQASRIYELGATTHLNTTIDVNDELRDGLIGHWTFDGVLDQIITDHSTNTNNGYFLNTVATSSATVPGKIGQALLLNGSDEALEVEHHASLNVGDGDLTVAAWINFDDYSSENGIINIGNPFNSSQNGYAFGVENNFTLYLWVADGTERGDMDSPSVFTLDLPGRWVHVAAVWDNSAEETQFYLDGETFGSPVASGATIDNIDAASFDDLTIGYKENNHYFDGRLDDVRLYNRELSDDEIRRMYELGATTKVNQTIVNNPDLSIESNLVHHWTFDGRDIDTSSTTGEIEDRGSDQIGGDAQNFADLQNVLRPGKVGQALEFDGGNDRLEFDNDIDFDGPTTFAAWVYAHAVGGEIIYLATTANTDYLRISPGTDGTMYCAADNTFGTGSNSRSSRDYPLNEWFHLVITKTTNLCTGMWFNGEDVWEFEPNFDTAPQVRQYLGEDDESANFDGMLDDVRIYNTLLPTTTIELLYESVSQ